MKKKSRLNLKTNLTLIVLLFFMPFFQNCGAGFNSVLVDSSTLSSQLDNSIPHVGSRETSPTRNETNGSEVSQVEPLPDEPKNENPIVEVKPPSLPIEPSPPSSETSQANNSPEQSSSEPSLKNYQCDFSNNNYDLIIDASKGGRLDQVSQIHQPGQMVRLKGQFDTNLSWNFQGQPGRPVCVNASQARVSGLFMTGSRYVEIHGLEISGLNQSGKSVGLNLSSNNLFVTFVKVHIHNFWQGALINSDRNPNVDTTDNHDITFVDTVIEKSKANGIVFNQGSGHRYHFFGGAFLNNAIDPKPEDGFPQGVYGSGGHGHIFDGVKFDNNGINHITVRRGGWIIRNCEFTNNATALSYFNQDDGSSKNGNGKILIYNNHFSKTQTVLYHGSNEMFGTNSANNSFYIFNNVINYSSNLFHATGPESLPQYYNYYIRNNIFIAGKDNGLKAPASGKEHIYSHNYYQTQAQNIRGQNNILGADNNSAFISIKDRGVDQIGPGVLASDFIDVKGAGIDIGFESE